MDLRRLARGTVEWDRLEAVVRELARRNDREELRVTFLETDNWLSTPLVVDERWFVKVISPQNSLVHALITSARNLGAVTSGTPGFFDHVGTPLQMAERELRATRQMRAVGVDAPAPVAAFEAEGLGVLVLEYLPDFRTLDQLDADELAEMAPDLFGALARLHDEGLAHGDLRAENVLRRDGDLYFIDATTVRAAGRSAARSYDIASALGALAPRIGPRAAVEAAAGHYSPADLIAAREFLDFVALRPDHDVDAAAVKVELERAAA